MEKQAARRARPFLIALLIVHVALTSVQAFSLPLWGGHEADYFTVIRFLLREGRLPTADDYPDGDADIRQATQPPIYFLMAAPVVALFDDAQAVPPGVLPILLCPGGDASQRVNIPYLTDRAYNDPTQGAVAAGYALRILNVIFGALAVIFTYQTARTLFPRSPLIALCAAALLALEPMIVQFIPTISNDTLLLMVSAAGLWAAARVLTAPRLRVADLIVLLALGVAAPLIKLPGWAVLALTLLVLVYRVLTAGQYRRILLIGLGGVLVITLAIALFNQAQYGSILGRYAFISDRLANLGETLLVPPVVIIGVFDHTFNELRGSLMALSPRAAILNAYSLLLVMAWVGAWIGIVWLARRRETRTGAVLAAVTVTISVIMVMLRNTFNANAENTTLYNTAMIFAPLRYYIPGLPAAALLIAAGLSAILPRISRGAAAVVPAGAFAGVALLGAFVLLAERPQITVDPAVFDQLAGVERVSGGASPADSGLPQVIGYRLDQRPADGVVDVTLYATVEQPTPINYVGALTFSDAGGVRGACEFLPVRGLYPVPRWEPGEIVRLDVRMPYCAAGGVESWAADTRLSLNWIAHADDGSRLESTAPLTFPDSLQAPQRTADTCPPAIGVIDGRFRLVKWNSPESVRVGEVYLPSVNWLMLGDSQPGITRVFRFVHEASGAEMLCSGSPSEDRLPISRWRRAESVFFDQCQMRFAADAPSGAYRVYTGIETASGERLPVESALDADAAAVGWLYTGRVSVQGGE
ncbi:MAG: glycosyltransferase family 39 protein [bacterium]|nr:glycosyltransferase family 39 protein [bacterium]